MHYIVSTWRQANKRGTDSHSVPLWHCSTSPILMLSWIDKAEKQDTLQFTCCQGRTIWRMQHLNFNGGICVFPLPWCINTYSVTAASFSLRVHNAVHILFMCKSHLLSERRGRAVLWPDLMNTVLLHARARAHMKDKAASCVIKTSR